MARQWDVVVVGAGPAGLSAARAVAEAGLTCVCVDRMGCGGALMNHGALHDCPEAEGMPGPDFGAALLEQAMGAGVELAIAEVTGLAPGWTVATDDEAHAAKAVIVATGLTAGTLGLDNEAEYEGRGLSHCAACDGPLYRGQPVAVVGADRWAVQEAVELAETASQVTLVTEGAAVAASDGVTVLPGRVAALEGAEGLEAIVVDGERVPARAIFVQAGRHPDVAVLGDSAGQPGLFLAGDARSGNPRTISAAIADGRRAGLDAIAYAQSLSA